MTREPWDAYFMRIATDVATRATCPRRKVGCVLVRDRQILATGYNGSIRGLAHCADVGCLMDDGHCVRTIHAEANAIVQAARDIAGATAYITASPCFSCFKLLANAGIVRIVFGDMYPNQHLASFAAAAHVELVGPPVLFCDFDGVLNGQCTEEDPSPVHPKLFLNPTLVERLNRIVEQTGAGVVLSTSWRYRTDATGCSVDVREALRLAGFRGRVIGQTPDMRPAGQLGTYTPRSDEIRAWLAAHPCDRFATLDDHGDADVDGRGVRTDADVGLSEADVEMAVRVLGEKR